MKKYHYTYKTDDLHFPAFSKDCLFLDIETTGFDRRSTFLTIIGLAWMEEDHIIIEQWFNDTGAIKEPILLMELEKLICQRNFPTLLHYNGTTFDLPYLKTKYETYHLPTSLCDCNSIDLYRLAKKYRSFLDLKGLKQKNLEECFGLYRDDTLSGQELITAYLDGIKYNNSELLDMYLLHNKEDMEGMVLLQNLLKLDSVFHGSFEITSWEHSQDHPHLFVELEHGCYLPKPLSFSYHDIHITFEKKKATIQIPIVELEAKYFFPNYKDYYYLPFEDRAIHKSVSSFVEKEFRQKATKETCYIKKTASYLPLPLSENSRARKECLKECCDLELFYENYGDSTAYVSVSLENEAHRKILIKILLLSLL